MSRNGWWFACAVLVLAAAPGCVGSADDVGSTEQALSLQGLAASEHGREVASELETCDCVEAGRTAAALGHVVVWGALDLPADIAVLEIDGVVACSAPVASLGAGEQVHLVWFRPLGVRPDPEPAKPDQNRPDPEPASPDENRPDPEPATGGTGTDSDDDTSPDENRPDPEPAGGGTMAVTVTTL